MHHQSRCFVPAATPTCFIRFAYLSLRPQLYASSPTKPHATLDIKFHSEPDTPLSHNPGLEVFRLYRDDSKQPADAQSSDDVHPSSFQGDLFSSSRASSCRRPCESGKVVSGIGYPPYAISLFSISRLQKREMGSASRIFNPMIRSQCSQA